MDGGAYNSAWRVPRKAQRDRIDFLSGFVRENVKQLADMSHADRQRARRRSSATSGFGTNLEEGRIRRTRPGRRGRFHRRRHHHPHDRRYSGRSSSTEGRFLPYFFPDDVLRGQRIRASKASTTGARPAARYLRSPISRHGLRRLPLPGGQVPEVRGDWRPISPTNSATSTTAPVGWPPKVSSTWRF